MTNELTLESARNLDDAQIITAILNGLTGMASELRLACVAVLVAKERGLKLPTLPSVFEYAKHIADGKLSPRAAMTLCRFPFTVDAVMKMPHDMQDRLADGEKVKIAVKVNGRVQSAERSIWEMSALQMRLAFSEGSVAPWEEQGEWLHKTGYQEPKPAAALPRFDKKAGKIVDGRHRRSIEDYRQAFAEAGYKIEPIYRAPRAAARTASTHGTEIAAPN